MSHMDYVGRRKVEKLAREILALNAAEAKLLKRKLESPPEPGAPDPAPSPPRGTGPRPRNDDALYDRSEISQADAIAAGLWGLVHTPGDSMG